MKKVFIIVLNYNNAEDTIECLDSLKFFYEEYQVVLVDNNSNSDCINKLEKNVSHHIKFIKNSENLGYAEGNNVGIRYAIENNAQIIVILNNDVIVNPESFKSSIATIERDREIAVIGPTILEYGKKIIQSAGADIDYYKVTSKLIKHGEDYLPKKQLIECDYVGGACMIFRAELISEIGYIPTDYFLFFEETEWCVKALNAGYKVVCNLDSYVMHKGSATIKKTSGMSRYYLERNRARFIVKNAPNHFVKFFSLVFLFLKAIIKGVVRDRKDFELIKYYCDGIRGEYSNY